MRVQINLNLIDHLVWSGFPWLTILRKLLPWGSSLRWKTFESICWPDSSGNLKLPRSIVVVLQATQTTFVFILCQVQLADVILNHSGCNCFPSISSSISSCTYPNKFTIQLKVILYFAGKKRYNVVSNSLNCRKRYASDVELLEHVIERINFCI